MFPFLQNWIKKDGLYDTIQRLSTIHRIYLVENVFFRNDSELFSTM